MDKTVSPGLRHLLVHLGDDDLGRLCPRPGDIDGDAEAAVAKGIRRTHLDKGDIEADPAAVEHLRYAGEIGRDIVDSADRCRLAHRPADKKEFE